MTDDTPADHRPRQLVHDVREKVHEARASVRSEMMNGGVTSDTQLQFATVLLTYRDVLSEHRDESILEPEWAERGVDWLERASRQSVTERITQPGVLDGRKSVDRNALVACDVERLLDTADALDRVAKDLGFTANTPDHTPDSEWDLGDLVQLMAVRGQPALSEVYDAWWDGDAPNGGETDGDNTDDQTAGDGGPGDEAATGD